MTEAQPSPSAPAWGEYRPLGLDPEDPKFQPTPSQVLANLEFFIARYVALPRGALLPVALWTVATHIFEQFSAFPYLCITSAVPGCGKTRLLEILELFCARPWRGTTLSPAALFRQVSAVHPTLLLDQAEALSNVKSESAQALKAILDVGYRQGGSVSRCEPPKFEVRHFDVYSAKALTVIGHLPATLNDRSILLRMQKKKDSENIERFTFRRVRVEAEPLRWCVKLVADQIRTAAGEFYEALPALAFLADREGELWEPLFSVCGVITPSRISELRKNAEVLSAGKTTVERDESWALRLLCDLHDIWPGGGDSLSTEDVLRRLENVAEAPWFRPPQGRPEYELTPRRLAKWLRGFGIAPRNLRDGADVKKGYLLADFEEAFSRYIAPESATPLQANIGAGVGHF